MMDFDNLDLLALMPAFLRDDPATVALCHALQPAFAALDDQIKHILLYTNIDNLDGDVLDEVAWGMDIGWYSSTDTVAAKRDIVKNALSVFARRGTASAIRDAVAANFGDSVVEEWWQYDGDPGCFQILIEDPTATTTKAVQFLATVNAVKNVRSHLDGIYLLTRSDGPMRIGCVAVVADRERSVVVG